MSTTKFQPVPGEKKTTKVCNILKQLKHLRRQPRIQP